MPTTRAKILPVPVKIRRLVTLAPPSTPAAPPPPNNVRILRGAPVGFRPDRFQESREEIQALLQDQRSQLQVPLQIPKMPPPSSHISPNGHSSPPFLRKKQIRAVDLSDVHDFRSVLETFEQESRTPPGILELRCGFHRPVFCFQDRPGTVSKIRFFFFYLFRFFDLLGFFSLFH